MAGLAIYTDDYDPRRLHADQGAEGRDPSLVEAAARYGDRPATLVVDLDPPGGRIIWRFRARRGASTNRTEYFLADFETDRADLFEAFADALRDLPEEWNLPYTGDLRWDLGFALPRLGPQNGPSGPTMDPMGDGTSSHPVDSLEHALDALLAFRGEGRSGRVVIATDEQPGAIPHVDLLLVSGEDDGPTTPEEPTDPQWEGPLGMIQAERSPLSFRTPDPLDGLAASVLVLLGGLSLGSFLWAQPVHPITGLAALGGFAGGAVGAALLAGWHNGLDLDRRPPALQAVVVVTAYLTLCAFLFPTVFRVSGRLLTGQSWLLGVVSRPLGALLSVIVFLPLVAALGIGVLLSLAEERPSPRALAVLLVTLGAPYGFGLLVMTGLAAPLWFEIIPSV